MTRRHPVPPERLYHLVDVDHPLEVGPVHLGYFGVLYGSRRLDEVFAALAEVAPDLRRMLRLHVFTRDPEALTPEVEAAGLAEVVRVHGFLDYLEYLNLCTRLDVLLVTDARTAGTHPTNPYLPSKYSDYLGSGSEIWGVVEPGSVLSELPLSHRSELGDLPGAVAVLEGLARRAAEQTPAGAGSD